MTSALEISTSLSISCILWIPRAYVSCAIIQYLYDTTLSERLSAHVRLRVQTQALGFSPCCSNGGQRPRRRDPHTTANVGQKVDREGVEGT